MSPIGCALVSLICLLATGACGDDGGPTGPSDGPQAGVVYRDDRPDNAHSGAINGQLGGDPKTGCLWLTMDGKTQRSQIKPHGPFTVTWRDGLRLYREGKLYASGGEDTGFGYGGDTEGVVGCPVPGARATVVY